MARPFLLKDLWDAIATLLPSLRPGPKGGHRPIENRAALTGILFVLRSGLRWEMLPTDKGCGREMSTWRRLRDWQAAGGMGAPAIRSCWSTCTQAVGLTGARLPGQRACLGEKRGSATGLNLTDRGKPGTKRRFVTDARRTLLMVSL